MGRKQHYGHFKQQTNDISHLDVAKNVNLRKETESLLITVQKRHKDQSNQS